VSYGYGEHVLTSATTAPSWLCTAQTWIDLAWHQHNNSNGLARVRLSMSKLCSVSCSVTALATATPSLPVLVPGCRCVLKVLPFYSNASLTCDEGVVPLDEATHQASCIPQCVALVCSACAVLQVSPSTSLRPSPEMAVWCQWWRPSRRVPGTQRQQWPRWWQQRQHQQIPYKQWA
jgi:hypothetical protein